MHGPYQTQAPCPDRLCELAYLLLFHSFFGPLRITRNRSIVEVTLSHHDIGNPRFFKNEDELRSRLRAAIK